MIVTLAEICTAVRDALSAATEVYRAQGPGELTEGINDPRLLQVYPDNGRQDAGGGNTDRTTFQGRVRQTELVVFADYYARQRSHIGEDMAQLVAGIDAIIAVLEAQNTAPFFGLAGIKAFSWAFQRVVFEYGDPGIRYMGARFTLTIRVF